MKKLTLNKETVRNLNAEDLDAIIGGQANNDLSIKGPACLRTQGCPTVLMNN